MKITAEEKSLIFSIIQDNFDWCTRDIILENHVRSNFNKRELHNKFSLHNGAVKYCVSSILFENYVVKFCGEEFDYCEREYTNYLAAVDRGLEEFFPYTDFLGELNGLKLYIQERAVCDCEYVNSIWHESLRESYEGAFEDEDEDFINSRIWDAVDDLEDDERLQMIYHVEDLEDFINEYCINDLHEANFGFVDERLVIIDFSGYGWRATERAF